ncbi:hypothetical protein DTO169E5_3877 [Paecilomyces variotii]|nr:hypothetical protein DTO169E5_3877 [Paecilomyces variotii]
MTIGSHNAIVNPFADGGSFASSADPSEPPSCKSDAVLRVGKHATLTLGTDALTVLDEGDANKARRRCCDRKTNQTVPYYNVLSANVSENEITITYAEPMSKSHVTVGYIHYPIDLEQKSKADTWAEKLLQLSYGEAKPKKKLKVLINPFGGKGMAPTYYSRYAEPILAAAGCDLDVQTTTHRGHATDIAEKLDINAYDAVVACSGDGLPYEIFNGLAKKPNAREALAKVAVGMIPSGSGNGMAMNLYGSPSVSLAALAIVKGKRMPLDLASITQGGTRTLSFLSQSFGIVAECDLGTDNIRWMGPHRFTYGFLVRLMGKTVWPCDVAVKVEVGDKQAIKDHYRAEVHKEPRLLTDTEVEELPEGLPPLRYGTVNDEIPDDWERLPGETMGNFYAGNMAWMSSDANFFPAALPNDGLLDLVTIDGTIPRLKSLSMLLAVEDGSIFDIPEAHFRKVSAYRLVPKQTEGYISIDGERVPFAPIQVEVHKGLGTVLSVSGKAYEAKGPPGTQT